MCFESISLNRYTFWNRWIIRPLMSDQNKKNPAQLIKMQQIIQFCSPIEFFLAFHSLRSAPLDYHTKLFYIFSPIFSQARRILISHHPLQIDRIKDVRGQGGHNSVNRTWYCNIILSHADPYFPQSVQPQRSHPPPHHLALSMGTRAHTGDLINTVTTTDRESIVLRFR